MIELRLRRRCVFTTEHPQFSFAHRHTHCLEKRHVSRREQSIRTYLMAWTRWRRLWCSHAFPMLFLDIVDKQIVVNIRCTTIEEFSAEEKKFIFQRMFRQRGINPKTLRSPSFRWSKKISTVVMVDFHWALRWPLLPSHCPCWFVCWSIVRYFPRRETSKLILVVSIDLPLQVVRFVSSILFRFSSSLWSLFWERQHLSFSDLYSCPFSK